MFLQTYGLLYERNAHIFTDMFKQLEKYYTNGSIELNEVFDSFFHLLYSKMFQVLNTQYTFDDKYLNCVSEKMDELKPFGDIPKKIKTEVKRSFIATRTFVQSMLGASEILEKLENLMTLSPSGECSKALDVFSSCPDCLNSTNYASPHSNDDHFKGTNSNNNIKFCSSVCTKAMYKCLNFNNDLNDEWNKFVAALLSLLTRLETSFNIEAVVEPIDIKISEAIMNFQDNGVAISNKLFDQCGKPKIGKRAVNNDQFGGKRERRWTSTHTQTRHSSSSSSQHKLTPGTRNHPSTDVELDDGDDDEDSDDESLDENTKSHSSSSRSDFATGSHSSIPSSSSSHGQLLPLTSGSSTSSLSNLSPGAAIDNLLAEVKKKVKKTRDYWKRLPSIICSHKFINQVTRSTDCWNGTHVIP